MTMLESFQDGLVRDKRTDAMRRGTKEGAKKDDERQVPPLSNGRWPYFALEEYWTIVRAGSVVLISAGDRDGSNSGQSRD